MHVHEYTYTVYKYTYIYMYMYMYMYIFIYIYLYTHGPVSRVHGPPPFPSGMGGYPTPNLFLFWLGS